MRILWQLQDGLVTEEQITESCIRVFTTRFLLGMFDGSEYDDIPYEVVECREHRQLAVEAAQKGAVLLKNDGILPLDKKKIRTIGVVGPNANNRIALQKLPRNILTVCDGSGRNSERGRRGLPCTLCRGIPYV